MKELASIEEYIFSPKTENEKDHLVFPLFVKIFGSGNIEKQNGAENADIHIPGKIVVELKTDFDEWTAGFFQALHYKLKGLSFSSVCVISHHFIGVWKLSQVTSAALKLHKSADASEPANEIGKTLARKFSAAEKSDLLKSGDCFHFKAGDLFTAQYLAMFHDILKNLDSVRRQVNPRNFIQRIEYLHKFFDSPMEAVHCFYTILPFWDIQSSIPVPPPSESNSISIISSQGALSEKFTLNPRHQGDFRKFVEEHYVFTNEEAGTTTDTYFSRFDEVMQGIAPEFVRQHGIFFTDQNLSKLALWFVHEHYETKLSEKYIVLDPAGGSGNLVSSWRRNHLKHKIISELEPDLLKIIERRMRNDPAHQGPGFTIVPKTSENVGLNFLDKPAADYLATLDTALADKGLRLDKPFAFLLNPPYKNMDENESKRSEQKADYVIHSTISELTGDDAGKERYAAFLAQILNICKVQTARSPGFSPLVMIFTPTAWLIPRPAYVGFRKIWDNHFEFQDGFLVTGNEFFKIGGRFPVSFTIWKFKASVRTIPQKIKIRDYTALTADALIKVNWNASLDQLQKQVKGLLKNSKLVLFTERGISIKQWCGQKMYDFKRDRTKAEIRLGVVGGLPLTDPRRTKNKKTYGVSDSMFAGFMDDSTPVRVDSKDDELRFSEDHRKRVWFRFDTAFLDMNKSRCLNATPDQKGYCAFDLPSAQKTFTWFALTKALNGNYPVWANQFDIWTPKVEGNPELARKLFSLSFAFGLAENRCVVTKFEKDNPVKGAPEVFMGNPLCPNDPESFWSEVIEKQVSGSGALKLVETVKRVYTLWDEMICKGQVIKNVGLDQEAYFRFFSYPDFVTPSSGLVQIRKWVEIHGSAELEEALKQVKENTAKVQEEVRRLIVEDLHYFG